MWYLIEFDAALRGEILRALAVADIAARDGAVYVQTNGPRFETKPEIKMMANIGEVLGMTGICLLFSPTM